MCERCMMGRSTKRRKEEANAQGKSVDVRVVMGAMARKGSGQEHLARPAGRVIHLSDGRIEQDEAVAMNAESAAP